MCRPTPSQPGALAPDGLPIAWLLTYFGTTNVNANADPTGKGMTLGKTISRARIRTTPTAFLRITAESFSSGGTSASLTWDSVPTRLLLHSEDISILNPPSLDGQRLGTRFAIRRVHHDGRFHRHQSGGAILSRPGCSSAHTVNTVKVLWPDTGSCQLRQNSHLTLPANRPSSVGVTTSNGINYLNITSPTGNLFFRLSNP